MPVFVAREVLSRAAFTTEMLMNTNTKSIYMCSLDMLTNVERGERERTKKTKKWKRLSKVQRERERRIASLSSSSLA